MTTDQLLVAHRTLHYAADTDHIRDYFDDYDQDQQIAILDYLYEVDRELGKRIIEEAAG